MTLEMAPGPWAKFSIENLIPDNVTTIVTKLSAIMHYGTQIH